MNYRIVCVTKNGDILTHSYQHYSLASKDFDEIVKDKSFYGKILVYASLFENETGLIVHAALTE